MAITQLDSAMAPYQILDPDGNVVGNVPDLGAERLLSLYRSMQQGRAFSNKIIALQRQGRATTFGSLVRAGGDCCRAGRAYAAAGLAGYLVS